MFQNKIFLISFIFSVFITLLSFNATAVETKTVTLDVPGMTCKFCPITVRKALKKIPGVIDAKSDYETKTATVIFDPAKTSVESLTEATKNVGYPSSLKQN